MGERDDGGAWISDPGRAGFRHQADIMARKQRFKQCGKRVRRGMFVQFTNGNFRERTADAEGLQKRAGSLRVFGDKVIEPQRDRNHVLRQDRARVHRLGQICRNQIEAA